MILVDILLSGCLDLDGLPSNIVYKLYRALWDACQYQCL